MHPVLLRVSAISKLLATVYICDRIMSTFLKNFSLHHRCILFIKVERNLQSLLSYASYKHLCRNISSKSISYRALCRGMPAFIPWKWYCPFSMLRRCHIRRC